MRLRPPGYTVRLEPEDLGAWTVRSGGKRLCVAGQHTRHLVVYAIDPQRGSLRETQRLDVGQAPAWVLSVSDR